MDKNICEMLFDEICYGYEPESEHWVRTTHVNDPYSFYVFPIKYRPHLELIESNIQSAETETDIEILQRVAFKSILLPVPKIIRGQISSIDETKPSKTCDILALDYGFVEKAVPLNYIFKCEESISQIPPLALHCKLHMCEPRGNKSWSSDCVDALKYYIGDEKAKMIVKSKAYNKLIVEMINTCPDDIATMMALSGSSTFGYVDPLKNKTSLKSCRTKKLFYNFKERNINETLHVRMLHGKKLDEFYVSEIGEYNDFLSKKNLMDSFAKREKLITKEEMLIGHPVLVRDTLRNIERALIESVSASKTESTVHFVDKGKKVTAHINNMINIPDECLKSHPLAIYCTTENMPTGVSYQKFFLPGFEFLITIKDVGSALKSPYTVEVSLLKEK